MVRLFFVLEISNNVVASVNFELNVTLENGKNAKILIKQVA